MVNCFRSKKPQDLIDAMKVLNVYLPGIPNALFGPTLEKGPNRFITDHPYLLLKEGKVNDVPIIISNVKDEGVYPVGCKLYFSFSFK